MTAHVAPDVPEPHASPGEIPRAAPPPFHHAPLAAAMAAVRAAWEDATERHAPVYVPFVAALEALAADARAVGVSIVELLKAVDALARPPRGGDDRLDWDAVRIKAGVHLIRAYYADD
jgi:hypothetical protein